MNDKKQAPNLKLHINEIVLHGFANNDQHAIANAVTQELSRLFSEQGVPPSLYEGGTHYINAGAFQSDQGARPDRVGRQTAQTLYKGLGRVKTPTRMGQSNTVPQGRSGQ